MKILEAKSWLDGHPQFQTESQWAYVMRMLTGYGAAVERAVEAAAIERCAKALYGRLMRQDVGFEEAHLSLNVGGVPPTEHEFVEAIRALLPKEES